MEPNWWDQKQAPTESNSQDTAISSKHNSDLLDSLASPSGRKEGQSQCLPLARRFIFEYQRFVFFDQEENKHWSSVTPTGFTQISNNCYGNSVLQLLLNVPALRSYLLSRQHNMNCIKPKGQWCPLCELESLTQKSFNGRYASISAEELWKHLPRILPNLAFGNQEDAEEFLSGILSTFEKIMLLEVKQDGFKGREVETTLLHHTFGHYTCTSVQCLHCNHVSRSFVSEYTLMVNMLQTPCIEQDLEELMERHFLEETIDDYKCESCSNKGIVKSLHLETAPNYLIIVVKRYQLKVLMGDFVQVKNEDHVTFTRQLDLQRFMRPGALDQQPVRYSLQSVIVHDGHGSDRFLGGHYVALVNRKGWYMCNDAHIIPMQSADVYNNQAYLLCYKREQRRPHIHVRSPPASQLQQRASMPRLRKPLLHNPQNMAEAGRTSSLPGGQNLRQFANTFPRNPPLQQGFLLRAERQAVGSSLSSMTQSATSSQHGVTLDGGVMADADSNTVVSSIDNSAVQAKYVEEASCGSLLRNEVSFGRPNSSKLSALQEVIEQPLDGLVPGSKIGRMEQEDADTTSSSCSAMSRDSEQGRQDLGAPLGGNKEIGDETDDSSRSSEPNHLIENQHGNMLVDTVDQQQQLTMGDSDRNSKRYKRANMDTSGVLHGQKFQIDSMDLPDGCETYQQHTASQDTNTISMNSAGNIVTDSKLAKQQALANISPVLSNASSVCDRLYISPTTHTRTGKPVAESVMYDDAAIVTPWLSEAIQKIDFCKHTYSEPPVVRGRTTSGTGKLGTEEWYAGVMLDTDISEESTPYSSKTTLSQNQSQKIRRRQIERLTVSNNFETQQHSPLVENCDVNQQYSPASSGKSLVECNSSTGYITPTSHTSSPTSVSQQSHRYDDSSPSSSHAVSCPAKYNLLQTGQCCHPSTDTSILTPKSRTKLFDKSALLSAPSVRRSSRRSLRHAKEVAYRLKQWKQHHQSSSSCSYQDNQKEISRNPKSRCTLNYNQVLAQKLKDKIQQDGLIKESQAHLDYVEWLSKCRQPIDTCDSLIDQIRLSSPMTGKQHRNKLSMNKTTSLQCDSSPKQQSHKRTYWRELSSHTTQLSLKQKGREPGQHSKQSNQSEADVTPEVLQEFTEACKNTHSSVAQHLNYEEYDFWRQHVARREGYILRLDSSKRQDSASTPSGIARTSPVTAPQRSAVFDSPFSDTEARVPHRADTIKPEHSSQTVSSQNDCASSRQGCCAPSSVDNGSQGESAPSLKQAAADNTITGKRIAELMANFAELQVLDTDVLDSAEDLENESQRLFSVLQAQAEKLEQEFHVSSWEGPH